MKRCMFFCLTILIFSSLNAQNHLKIKEAFDKYGKQEKAVLVQLASDVLSQGSDLTFYKSLIVDANGARQQEILSLLAQDVRQGQILTEIRRGGMLESGSYLISATKKTSEFILYKYQSGKITLVYLTGNFQPERLGSELKKLKDLFIYVNNKRLKIQ